MSRGIILIIQKRDIFYLKYVRKCIFDEIYIMAQQKGFDWTNREISNASGIRNFPVHSIVLFFLDHTVYHQKYIFWHISNKKCLCFE